MIADNQIGSDVHLSSRNVSGPRVSPSSLISVLRSREHEATQQWIGEWGDTERGDNLPVCEAPCAVRPFVPAVDELTHNGKRRRLLDL